MRIYIIGNDGITLCREPPATIDKGEIAVASREELHAARLSGKRLLALWNALPGVEKLTKVGDRSMLIDRLWPAIEALPDPDQQSDTKRPSKQHAVIAMLQRPEGATVDEVATAMGWQRLWLPKIASGLAQLPRWATLITGMIDLVKRLGGLLVGVFRSHAAREAEMAFLRQQLVVLQRSAPARLRLRCADRVIFVWLYRRRS